MFDIGFSELFLIAVVALLVLGPERLPKAARFAGLWVRRARAQWYSVRSELERELASEELKRTLHDTRQSVSEIGDDVRAVEADARREFDAMRSQLAHGATQNDGGGFDDSTALIDDDDKALFAAASPAEPDDAADARITDQSAAVETAADGSGDVSR